MKAFYINNPSECSISDTLAIPEISGKEVLVKIRKAGFCGTDLNTYRGKNPIVSFPIIPGHELAGEVVKKGPDVPDSIAEGDRVSVLPYTTCGVCRSCQKGRVNACKNNETLGNQRDGGMVEYLAVPYDKLITGLNELDYQSIAMVEPLAVGFHAAERCAPAKGDYMLVFGCGLVGLGAICRGNILGARVIAVDLDDEKLALAKKMGAEFVINSKSQDLEKVAAELTGGHGPDVVLEAIGLPVTFKAAVDLVSFAGRVVYVGYAKEAVDYETKKFIMKELDIRGSRNALRSDFENVLDAHKKSLIPVSDLVTKDVPLEEAGEMLEYWSQNPGKVSKILVSVS